jgi:hypothetical protein
MLKRDDYIQINVLAEKFLNDLVRLMVRRGITPDIESDYDKTLQELGPDLEPICDKSKRRVQTVMPHLSDAGHKAVCSMIIHQTLPKECYAIDPPDYSAIGASSVAISSSLSSAKLAICSQSSAICNKD